MASIIFILAFLWYASGKTVRYFLSNNASLVARLIKTVEVIAVNGKNEPIATPNGKFYAEEYQLPKTMVDWINCVKVNFNQESVGCGEFMPKGRELIFPEHEFPSEVESIVKCLNDTTKPLSPEEVVAFFKGYNENQGEGEKLETVPVKFERHYLSEFQELVTMKEGSDAFEVVEWNSAGQMSGYLAILANLQSPVDAKYLHVKKGPNVEEVARWIFRK